MSATAAPADQSARSDPGPAEAFGMVLDAAVSAVAAKLERKTAGWIDKLNAAGSKGHSSDALIGLTDAGLDAVAESGGVGPRATAEGVKARMHGKNPVWAAIRGVWQAGTPAVRAAIVTSAVAAVVLLLLSPALLVIYLLSWLVIAAVCRLRANRHPHRKAA